MSMYDKRFGIDDLIHFDLIDVFEDSSSKPSTYKYVAEIVDVEDHNGNGYDHLKIYTDGKLKELIAGNWRIKPIIIMPYNWTGYDVKIEMQDSKSNLIVIRETPSYSSIYKKGSFYPEVEWVFKMICQISKIEGCEELALAKKELEEELLNINDDGQSFYSETKFLSGNTVVDQYNSLKFNLRNKIDQYVIESFSFLRDQRMCLDWIDGILKNSNVKSSIASDIKNHAEIRYLVLDKYTKKHAI